MGAVGEIQRDAVAFDEDGLTEVGKETNPSPIPFDPYAANDEALRKEWGRLSDVINGGNHTHRDFEQRALVAYRFGD